MGITTRKYFEVKEKFDFYYNQFVDLRASINSLKKSERQFRKIFSLENKEDIYKTMDAADTGSLDIELIKKQIEQTILNVGEIKDYLRQQRDVYYATPMGYPVTDGYISSDFGQRIHPRSGLQEFHTGADIATSPGTPIKATADGIVSFSGWSGGSGQLVVIEHGFGFTTCYAHNKKLNADVGQKIKRGDVVGYVGSTGNTTGPHVHYEVWVNRKPVNPEKYLALHQDTRQNVQQKTRQD
jgi:murein DD-endopeptidase MepM/ murein hydrolase activator NlpD